MTRKLECRHCGAIKRVDGKPCPCLIRQYKNTENVEHMAEKAEDNTLWTPEQILQIALDEVRSGKTTMGKCKKMMILGLDDSGEAFNHPFLCSNMKGSECVALLEMNKHEMIRSMCGD